MALPPLATGSDLAAFLQRDIDQATAVLALRLASGTVRRFTRQTLSLVVDDTIVRIPQHAAKLVLPQRPVVAVTAVTVLGEPSTDWVLEGDALVRECGWPNGATITYTHGYADIPDDIQGIVLGLAASTMTNPGGLRSQSIDDYSETYATETLGAGKLTDADKDILRNYRRRAFSVVPS